MAKLVLIHDSGMAGEYELKPGKNTVGRDSHNDLCIDHESVSDHHCAIESNGSVILVRDLGSVHGTWVDSVQVDEARLREGQMVQIGEIQFVLALPAIVGERPSGAAPSSGSVYCRACNRWLPAGETQRQRIGPALVHFCPQCGGQCSSATVGPGVTRDSTDPTSFTQGAIGAFSYPSRSSRLSSWSF